MHQYIAHNTQRNITTISKTPNTPNYIPVRTNRVRGPLRYIEHNIIFTDLNIHTDINTHNTEQQMVRIQTYKHTTVAKLYIPPQDAANKYKT